MIARIAALTLAGIGFVIFPIVDAVLVVIGVATLIGRFFASD